MAVALDGVVAVPVVPPGSYQVEARLGTCANDTVGCAAEGSRLRYDGPSISQPSQTEADAFTGLRRPR